jgi:hypothetical protein
MQSRVRLLALSATALGREVLQMGYQIRDYFFGFISKKIPHLNLKKITPQQNKAHTSRLRVQLSNDRGDVPGWVLVVLMTTGLVTAIWAVAAPRLNAILKNSFDAMNMIR